MSENPTASRVDEVVEDLQADDNVRPYHIDHDTGEVRLWVVPEAADEDTSAGTTDNAEDL